MCGEGKIKLAYGYENRRLMLVGDGLSQIWVKTCTRIISNATYSTFNEEHENTVIIQRALKQVVNVTGDLYGEWFHFLQEIYTLLFGILIQPVQALLGWKLVKGSDVTTLYQQAVGITIIMDN